MEFKLKYFETDYIKIEDGNITVKNYVGSMPTANGTKFNGIEWSFEAYKQILESIKKFENDIKVMKESNVV